MLALRKYVANTAAIAMTGVTTRPKLILGIEKRAAFFCFLRRACLRVIGCHLDLF